MTYLRLHVHSSCCGTSMAFFLHLETTHHHPHCSPTFKSFPCWVPVVIAMCYQEWQMIIWLRSHIHKSSSTRYTEHLYNNYMLTSSHIQIINLKVNVLAASLVREQVPDRDLVVRMRTIVRARAHFPPGLFYYCSCIKQ